MTEESPRGINYMMGHHPSVLKAHGNRTAAAYAAYLLPNIRPRDLILDVGCGPGSITAGLAEQAPNGWTVGIDYGAGAIEAAKENIKRNGGPKNCEFKISNAYALEWDEGSFDVVHTHQCLVHLDDPVKAFKEMRRVCKDGGIVGVREGNGSMTVTNILKQDILTAFSGLWRFYDLPRRSVIVPHIRYNWKSDAIRWQ